MKKRTAAILVVGALVVGLTIGGMSIASAASRTSQVQTASYSTATMMGTTSPIATLSNLTGLSAQEIQTLRAQGKSLSTIATENGVDPAAVVAQTVAARQTYLDSLVAAGRMTAAQEATMLEKTRVAVRAMMDAVPGISTRPSLTTTPSVPATGTVRDGYVCPTYGPANGAPAIVRPRSGSNTAGSGSCLNYVAPPAPTASVAPAAPVSGTNQNATSSQTSGSSYSGGSPSNMMGSGTGGSRGNGSCGW